MSFAPLIQYNINEPIMLQEFNNDNTNLDSDIEKGSLKGVDGVINILKGINANQVPSPTNLDRVRRKCLQSRDIISHIATFLLSPTLSKVNWLFNKANKSLKLKDAEMMILLNKNIGQSISLFEIIQVKNDLEKTLNWLNPQRLTEMRINQSDRGLLIYSKALLQKISILEAPERPTPDTQDKCSFRASKLTLNCSALFGSLSISFIVLLACSYIPKELIGTTQYYNNTDHEWHDNTPIDLEQFRRSTVPFFKSFIAITLFACFAFLTLSFSNSRRERREMEIYNRPAQRYLNVVRKCSIIIQSRSPLALQPPNMDNISHHIPQWFLNTYLEHPETTYRRDNHLSLT